MNILSVLKKKYDNVISRREEEVRGRRQFNMTVDERLIDEVKRLAAEFAVPRYVFGEHALECGSFYLDRAIRNERKREIVRRHLINTHLLDSGADDDEVILRIGEGRYASELLSLTKSVVGSWKVFQQAIYVTKRTGNVKYLEKCQRQLLESAVRLAIWLDSHLLDESENRETRNDKQKEEFDS
jgi:hypothetical protein